LGASIEWQDPIQDLRDRVVAAVASGRTCRATAALFGVSVASVVKWSQRWRATGSAAAKPMGGRRPLRLRGERAWLSARIAEKPDLTLRAVMAELAERGTPASYGAVWRFFRHEGITFKKKPARQRAEPAPAQAGDRADIARRRTRWKTHQGRLDPQRLVFIDETPACAGAGSGPRPT
jgi:transposase